MSAQGRLRDEAVQKIIDSRHLSNPIYPQDDGGLLISNKKMREALKELFDAAWQAREAECEGLRNRPCDTCRQLNDGLNATLASWERQKERIESLESALNDIIAEADQANGGTGAKLPIVVYIRELAESALSGKREEK